MTNIIDGIHKEFEESLIASMYQIHGPLVAKDHLWRELGCSSSVALRMAVNRGTVPVTLMELPHRHGRFGLTEEIAKWLLSRLHYYGIMAEPLAFITPSGTVH